jgi:hypothetical protein
MYLVKDYTLRKGKRDTAPIVCYTWKEGHEVMKKLNAVMKQAAWNELRK